MNCRNCNAWLPLETDERCGWCGHAFSFEVKVQPEVIYPTSGLDRVLLHIVNYNPRRLTLTWIEFSLPQFSGFWENYVGEREIEDRLTIPLDLRNLDFSQEIWADIVVQAVPTDAIEKNPDWCYEEKARFRVSYEPRLKLLNVPRIEVLCDGSDAWSERHTVTIGIESGSFRVSAVQISDAASWIELEPLPQPVVLSADCKQMHVSFRVNKKNLQRELGDSFPSERKLSLALLDEALALGKPLEPPITIYLQYPPKLRVDNAIESEIEGVETWTLKGTTKIYWDGRSEPRIRDIQISLENIGGSELKVEAIGLSSLRPWVELAISLFTVESRKNHIVTLRLDGNRARGENLDSLRLELTTRIQNDVSRKIAVVIPIEITELKRFQGFLAIDFGTSFTTCRYYSEESEASGLVRFRNGKTAIPTAVFYENFYQDQKLVYRIGEEALAGRASSSASVVTEVKRRLGSIKEIEVHFSNQANVIQKYKPEVIAGHFLAMLRGQIEDFLDRSVGPCVITHPVFFFDCSVQALRQAFELAGFKPEGFDDAGQSEPNILVEPVAAAFEYIIKRVEARQENSDSNGKEDQYRLAVFDFGGGTTDFSLIKVSCQYQDDQPPLLVAEIEEVDGERFGGYDVTYCLAEYLVKVWKEDYLKQPGASPVDIPLNLEEISAMPDAERRQEALANREEFLRKADAAKIALSEDMEHEVYLNPEKPSHGFRVKIIRDKLEELIQRDIHILVNTFKAMIEAEPNRKVDIIVVSGNSSRIPLVLKLLRQTFPDITIDPQPESSKERFASEAHLKESIVSGLLEYSLIRRVAIPTVVMDNYPQMPRKLIVCLGTTTRKNQRDYFAKILDKRAGLPTGWTPIRGAVLNRDVNIKILAMGGSGEEERLIVGDNGGRRNPRIQPLGAIDCARLELSNAELRKCAVEVKVEANRSVNVRINREGLAVFNETLHPEVILD